MGGKGRGVFSDFRLGRVGTPSHIELYGTDSITVPIPNQCARWKPAGCKEGQLVDLYWDEDRELCIILRGEESGIGRRTCVKNRWIIMTFTFGVLT
jgi:hypothetical protein